MKVQCISTKCGNYPELKIGKWYEVEVCGYRRSRRNVKNEPLYRILDIGKNFHSQTIYPQCLFRTVDERRDNRLNKLLK
jgi:hypothetical protein